MFGSTVIEVAIGLALVYLFLAIVCSAVSEAISNFLSLRAKTLKAGVERLLGDPDFASKLYANPLIKGLAKNDKSAPSYIPAEMFALALIEELSIEAKNMPPSASPTASTAAVDSGAVAQFQAQQAQAPQQQVGILDRLRAAAATGHLPGPLRALLNDSIITDTNKAKKAIANWFDRGMERSSGWYKRRTQQVIILVALGVTLALNVDSFRIAKALMQNATLRESIVASYSNTAKIPVPGTEGTPIARALQIERDLAELPLPIGWAVWPSEKGYTTVTAIGASVPGWLVTAMAASLGAPFWFDLLNKLVNLRMAGKMPQSTSEDAEKKGSQKQKQKKPDADESDTA